MALDSTFAPPCVEMACAFASLGFFDYLSLEAAFSNTEAPQLASRWMRR